VSPEPDPVTDYARRVTSGEIPAGKWQIASCNRHLKDLDASKHGGPYEYREDLADKAFQLFSLCRHDKGEWAGMPIRLEPWQQFVVGCLMGWVHRGTNLRRFRHAFVELPRGQGKSTIAGGLLVIFAFFLGEGGAESYSVATKKDQARISFQAGRQMLLRSPALKKHVTISKYNVHSMATESKMEALGSDADTLDGLRPFFVCVDEVHKLPSQDIVDVMVSGMGTRLNPMLFLITTAGDDDQSVYGQYALLTQRVLDGTIDLPDWFGFIAAADPEDDWTVEATWRKANPNFGISVKPEFIASEVRKALANPAEQAKVRRLYLGQKVSRATSRWTTGKPVRIYPMTKNSCAIPAGLGWTCRAPSTSRPRCWCGNSRMKSSPVSRISGCRPITWKSGATGTACRIRCMFPSGCRRPRAIPSTGLGSGAKSRHSRNSGTPRPSVTTRGMPRNSCRLCKMRMG
jgi:hypothetical protein